MELNLKNTIGLNQTQKLILSTKLKQSLAILNMNRLEVEEEILRESEINPIIEVERAEDEIDWEKFLKNMERNTPIDRNETAYKSDDEYDLENLVRSTTGFYENLINQLHLMEISKDSKEICEYIINSLDEDGYLRVSANEIMEELDINRYTFDKHLGYVQQLEPLGVGARTLSECLTIQLKAMGIHDPIILGIVKEDLGLIGNNKFKDIAKKYDISIPKCVGIINLIKSLEPKPGIAYSSDKSIFVEPDVIVERIYGKFLAYLNERDRYSLRISEYYLDILNNTEDDEAKAYIKEKLNSAMELIKSLEGRKNTILKIAKCIVKEQEEFFEKGEKYLKPLTMKGVAEEIDFHESTVSRGVNGKYMLTPNGMYELKYFFSTAICSDESDATSATSVKSYIKDFIASEDKSKPLSDDRIRDMLGDKGISISRRTVAKYRDELSIPSSSKRKIFVTGE